MADELTLTFTPQRLDYIANVLGQRPYAEVQDIIADIRNQIARQQQAPRLVTMPDAAVKSDEAA